MENDEVLTANMNDLNVAELVQTPHNTRLYEEVRTLKNFINELVEYQVAHLPESSAEGGEITEEQQAVNREIEKKEKYVRAQLSVIKALYRQSVLKVREEKAKTSEDRAVNDALILGLHNLKYEEQSLRSEISAAENYEYVARPSIETNH
jgi:THO complex subunit 5